MLASPGRKCTPPPTRDTIDAEWCGVRIGRTITGLKHSISPAALAQECMRVVSRISSSVISGRIPGRHLAHNDFPAPGEPTNRKLWAPAAATSRALLTPSIPMTFLKSGIPCMQAYPCPAPLSAPCAAASPAAEIALDTAPFSNTPTHSFRESAHTYRTPSTRRTSRSFPRGTTRTSLLRSGRLMATERTPRTGFSKPSRESSPTNTNRSKSGTSISPVATRRPIANGRSRALPSFRKSAGDKFTVVRKPVTTLSMERMAETTRSLDSLTALSGNPTKVKPGSP